MANDPDPNTATRYLESSTLVEPVVEVGFLANVLSGTGTDVGRLPAIAALAAWELISAAIGLIAVQRRDVV